jgi:hypothetical protein
LIEFGWFEVQIFREENPCKAKRSASNCARRTWNESGAVRVVRKPNSDGNMKARLTVLVLALVPVIALADTTEWQRYVIPSTGVYADIPVSIFTEDAGSPEGATGRRFFTKDRRANLTLESIPNPENDSPAKFLQKRQPPPGIQYRRVTSRFFAVSSIRNGRTWYNRCNRANGYMNCVLINYPAEENRQWDAVVTRISLSLAQ